MSLIATLPGVSYAGGSGGINATLPDMSSAIDTETPMDLHGWVPPLFKMEGAFGTEITVDAEVPGLLFSGSAGGDVEGELPYFSFEGEALLEVSGALEGKLPNASFTGESGGYLRSTLLPGLTFEGALSPSLVNNLEISGKLPAVKTDARSVPLIITGELDADLAPLEYEGRGTLLVLGEINSTLPTLLGELEQDIFYEGALSASLPPLEYLGDIIGDYNFTLTADLPALRSLYTLGASMTGASTGDIDEPTDDGIIRHRRGYDNG